MRSKITALVTAVAAAASAAGVAKWARARQGEDEPQLEVSAAELAPSDEVVSEAAPTPAPTASSGEGLDDLTAIKGLGKVKAAKLVASGITSYAQVAAWTDDDIAEVGLAVNTSPGQIKREDWVGQAKALAER